ncbi:MAG: molybdopterin-dependent oxidoreductase, partial [Deltaproteobacteria bacterium]|nr:molybdopterin-dependent oxidoreductase [Deltaproteobacteria bacterium]
MDSGIEIRKTICDICIKCGIDAYIKDGEVIKVEGSQENPQNAGKLCAKGAANRQYIYHKDRLRTPLFRKGERGSGEFHPISWDDAMNMVEDRLLRIKEEFGPESVIFYVGYPKWMRPFLKRLAHSFGSPNYCTESSVCSTATTVAAHLNYGSFGGPDLKKAKCLLVWSTNPFHSKAPAVKGLLKAREKGLKIIEVGPLLTPLTRYADIHLRIRPGTSGALALGMAHVIIEENLFDHEFIENWTKGFEEYRTYVQKYTPEKTEDITGVSALLITKAARLYANTKPAALMTGACPTTHHTNGIQNHRALTALIGLTGNFDMEGGNYVIPGSYLNAKNGIITRQHEFEQSRPFSEMAPRVGYDRYPIWCDMTGQAQAMHLPFQIESRNPYPIQAILAFGLNYRMWPGSDQMCQKLRKVDFLVDVDFFMTDSSKLADLVLPACTSFERNELKFYNQPYAIWTEPVIQPIGESRSDIDIIFDLAHRLTPGDDLMKAGYEGCLDWILKPANLNIASLKKFPGGRFIKNVSMPPYQKYKEAGFNTPSGKMEFSSSLLKDAGLDPLPKYKEPKLSPRST